MKVVVDSTDKKYIGEFVDEAQDVIVFSNGETLAVSVRLHNNSVLGNSNYLIVLSDKD